MSASIGKNIRLSSSLKIEEEAMVTEKQGIVSILRSDCERGKTASLRRTLSADMSSKKWLAQHGFSPMKKIASSEQFLVSIADSSSSSSEGEEDYEERKELERPGQFDFLSSIQSEQKKKELEKPGQFDIWSSILAQKADEDLSKSMPLPAPYIHPLVKRSSSSLSKNSLEICTESLGSETGSDGFSTYPSSETGDIEEDKEEEQEQKQEEEEKVLSQPYENEELRIVKYNCPYSKKSPPKSFPPPLPSLSCHDGASLHMRSHRKNGRLVLEAVSVPSQNYFRAQRQDGRLLLTFVNQEPNHEETIEEEEDNFEQVFDEEFEKFDEEEEEEEVENVAKETGSKEMGIMIEPAPKLMMNKLIRLANRNPAWPHKFNKVVKFEEEEEDHEEEATPQPQSLPPRPRVGGLISSPQTAAAASFNAYEYCWRTKPPTAPAGVLNPVTQQPPAPLKNNNNMFILSKNPKAHEQQQLLFSRGNKADYLVPLLRGCNEPRRSLLFWEPYCVATS